MARPLDPYRTLELPRDADLDEVKAAYRRLAKLYHPDSAGERALPRFLAVQAAYEMLTEGPGKLRAVLGGRPARASRSGADPWAGRPAGTGPRATRGATGSAGPSGARSGTRTGPRGAPTGPSAPRSGAGAGSSSDEGAAAGRAGSSRTRGPAGPRPRRTRRPPGSTSYDGADSEPFEPEWQGASWYGGSSGTYWTINPREFADPRKHGPEYLARGADGRRDAADDPWATGPAGGPAGDAFGSGPAGGPSRWPAGHGRRTDISPFGLIAAALVAIALVASLFALMAEPGAPGSASVVPLVAFSGVAIIAVVRALLRVGRPRT